MMSINKNIQILFSTIVTLLLFSSCSAELDKLRAHNVTDEEKLFSTPDGFQRAVEGIYSLSIYSFGDDLIYMGEAQGNNLRKLETTSSGIADVYSYTHIYFDLWTPSYKVIQQANMVLKNVKFSESDSIIKEAKAEALFCRAFAYFNLARCYGRPYYQSPETNPGVVIVTDPYDEGLRARNTVKETYEQIVNDLMLSIPCYTSNRGSSYASIYASKALLSRVYLYMGGTFSNPDKSYNDSVVKYTSEVIDGPFTLAQGSEYTNYFLNQNTSAGSVEDIFDTNTQSKRSYLHAKFTPIANNLTTSGGYSPSPSLIDLMNVESGDLRLTLFKKVTFGNSNIYGDSLSTIKYDVSGTTESDESSQSPIRHFRLVEMYLNRAEAYAKLGKNTESLTDLNTVRTRAGLSALSDGSLSGQELFDAIFTQRRLELAFEGHVGFDYFRNGLTMKRNYDFNEMSGVTVIKEMSPTDAKIVLLIPNSEIILNTKLQQNKQ
jgi:hypothetical protein